MFNCLTLFYVHFITVYLSNKEWTYEFCTRNSLRKLFPTYFIIMDYIVWIGEDVKQMGFLNAGILFQQVKRYQIINDG